MSFSNRNNPYSITDEDEQEEKTLIRRNSLTPEFSHVSQVVSRRNSLEIDVPIQHGLFARSNVHEFNLHKQRQELEIMSAFLRYDFHTSEKRKKALKDELIDEIKLAVINMDVTIKDNMGIGINVGLVEHLVELFQELYPHVHEIQSVSEAIEGVAPAVLPRVIDVASTSLKAVFKAFTKDDGSYNTSTQQAVIAYQAALASINPRKAEDSRCHPHLRQASEDKNIDNMTNHAYHLDLLHRIFYAEKLLTEEIHKIPGGSQGKLADKFSHHIIDPTLHELPLRVRNSLEILAKKVGLSAAAEMYIEQYIQVITALKPLRPGPSKPHCCATM